jgi:hypothetical protein
MPKYQVPRDLLPRDFRFGERVEHRGDGPTAGGDGDELAFFVREAALEVGLF